MATVAGTIEVIEGDESRGIPVVAVTTALVPTIVQAVYGVVNVVAAPTITGAVACWTAKTAIGAPAKVVLWPEAEIPAPRPQPIEEQP